MRNQITVAADCLDGKYSKAALLKSDEVLLTANVNGEGRELRLSRLIGFVCARFNCNPSELKSKYGLLALHDRKGNLTSVWRGATDFCNGIRNLNAAWCSENECDHTAVIYHYHCEDYQVVEVSA